MTVATEPEGTLAAALCRGTLEQVVRRTGLTEVLGEDGAPHRVLTSPMSPAPVGMMRVFTGTGVVAKAVYVGISVDAIGLDSHMVFAFTRSDSALPHFTLDSVRSAEYHAFHLDLIPRVDLASHLPYLDHCFAPLTATFEQLSSWEGLSPAAIGPRQRALMSEWMCVNRATEDAFRQMDGPVGDYLDHWVSLVDSGLPESVLTDLADTDLADRDRRNRTAVFNRDVDAVWDQIARLIGDQSEAIRVELLSNEVGS